MTADEYREAQDLLFQLGLLSESVDWREMIESMDHSRVAGAMMMPPMEYQIANQRMSHIRKCAEVLSTLRTEFEKLRHVINETQPTLDRIRAS